MAGCLAAATLLCSVAVAGAISVDVVVPPSPPPGRAGYIDPAQLSVSLEFFAFPDYMQIASTTNCLANIETLRGFPPAVRIGGTTQYAFYVGCGGFRFSSIPPSHLVHLS